MTYKLEPFIAIISNQGDDKHIHLPRKIYPKLKEDGKLGKKFRFIVVMEELPSTS